MKRLLADLRETVEENGFAWLVFWLVVVAMLALAAAKSCSAQVPAAAQYQRMYTRIATATWGGWSAPVASLAAQIEQESGWRCTAASRVGAQGCAQFMPATAKWISGFSPSLARGLVNDPAWAFEAQVRYMRWLYDRTSGATDCERIAFAQQSYNSGEAWVRRRKVMSPTPEVCFGATCNINPGVTPANQREAQQYPVRIRWIAPSYGKWGRVACT